MKSLTYILSFFALASLTSCTEVIELDLNDSEPGYVIEATLDAEAGIAEVFISQSGSFTDPGDYPQVSNAVVLLETESGLLWEVTETAPGEYVAENIEVESGDILTMTVEIDGQSYLSSVAVPNEVSIDSVEFMSAASPRFGEGKIPIVNYQNPGSGKLYFQVETLVPGTSQTVIPIENAVTDENITLFQAPFPVGTPLQLEVRSVTESVYRYLTEISELKGEGIGPASAAPSNPEYQWTGNALGYFSVYQPAVVQVIVE